MSLAAASFTFHYASTLSCADSLIDSVNDSIFTFHYASTLSVAKSRAVIWSGIYIPLCFYFITGYPYECMTSYKFTFHYASTLSKTELKKFLVNVSFTFHYASTLSLIKSRPQPTALLFTFHYASTLSRTQRKSTTGFSIYIPLCFYFIRFASTWRSEPLYLHSIMLLLYLE